MKDYNGFSAETRERSWEFMKPKLASGELPRPTRCQACGQEGGAIDYHTEDYSEPFGPHLWEHSLCYRCHILLHCRFKAREIFAEYVRRLKSGERFPKVWRRDFGAIRAILSGDWPETKAGPARERVHLLEDL